MNEPAHSSLLRSPARWVAFLLALAVGCGALASVGSVALEDGGEAGWTSLLPPLVAILVAIVFRELVLALTSAVIVGAALAFGPNPVVALWRGFSEFVWPNTGIEVQTAPLALSAGSNLYIFGFTFGLVGMVHVMTRSGGTKGLVDLVLRIASGARSTRVATALMGCVVFFDDYANCVVVGTTMRPLTDRVRISREKLAFLVDATAAPVSGVAIISTWVAYEAGLFGDISSTIGLELDGYSMFLAALPFRYYCATTLLFVFASSALGRDFGPMLAAERRAMERGELSRAGSAPLTSDVLDRLAPPEHAPHRWYNAALPILATVAAVVVGMLYSGSDAVTEAGLTMSLTSAAVWRTAFGAAASSEVLFWASLLGSLVAIGLAATQRVLSVGDAAIAWLRGIPAMRLAVLILLLAWSIKSVCDELHTRDFLVAALSAHVNVTFLPIATFLVAAGVAFSTGTSWGTMGILLPVALPLAYTMCGGESGGDLTIFWLVCAAVLDGAIFGDHCSPISDTTVLSSIASGCDHLDHVRTQAPYALVCMGIAGLCGYLGVALGLSTVASYGAIVLLTIALLFVVGRSVQRPPSSGGTAG
ncbi:MAG: Na+/H+ antiporter NhaC family protein [Myxococcales bacterium]|nr:Na+/H+ antiporter NhaC family protein [Myxococcales bacterium]